MTDSVWERVQLAFPHECVCHVKGCPGYGFCGDVTVVRRDPETREALEVIDCDSRECKCWTSSIMHLVQMERARTLMDAADALSIGLDKKPRAARTLYGWARDVADGLR